MKSLARAVPESKIRVSCFTIIYIMIKVIYIIFTLTKMTNEIIAGLVKADKHRGLVSPLPDGKEHGLPHVQVECQTSR